MAVCGGGVGTGDGVCVRCTFMIAGASCWVGVGDLDSLEGAVGVEDDAEAALGKVWAGIFWATAREVGTARGRGSVWRWTDVGGVGLLGMESMGASQPAMRQSVSSVSQCACSWV